MKLRNEKVNVKFVLDCLKNSIYKDSTIFKCNDAKSEEALNAIIKYWDSVSEDESEFSLEKFTRWKFTKDAKCIINDIGLTTEELGIKPYYEYSCDADLNKDAVEVLRPFYHIVTLSPNEIYYKELVDSLVHTVCISTNLTEEKLKALNPYTILRLSMEHGSPALFDMAIERGASPFCDLATALFKEPIISYAIFEKYTYIVNWLIENMPRSYIHSTFSEGKSLIHLLVDRFRDVGYYYAKFIKDLAKKGASVNTVDDYGNTPILDLVSINENLDDAEAAYILSTLIKSGANIEARDVNGRTPLHLIVMNNHDYLLGALLNNSSNVSVDVNIKDNEGETPLHLAALNYFPSGVSQLLLKGADVNAVDKYKRTPLMLAVKNCEFESAAHLLASGADVTLEDDYGNSVMHYYAKLDYSYRYYEKLLVLLIKFGADINALNKDGKTPLDYIRSSYIARDGLNFDVEAEMLKHGACTADMVKH